MLFWGEEGKGWAVVGSLHTSNKTKIRFLPPLSSGKAGAVFFFNSRKLNS